MEKKQIIPLAVAGRTDIIDVNNHDYCHCYVSSANLLFLFLMLIGPIFTLSSRNWVLAWIGVELTFIGIIPLLFLGNKYLSVTKEAIIKYFCIQSFRSGLLLFRGILIFFNLPYELIVVFRLCIKLGLFPGHFWVPSVINALEWVPCTLMLTWQKIPPFLLLRTLTETRKLILVLGGIRAIVGAFIGNNTTRVRRIIGASSISHSGWASIGVVSGSLWTYFGLYCAVLAVSVALLRSNHVYASISILSMSGLPPFIIFVGKWKVILGRVMVWTKFLVLPVLGTVLSLIFYLKFTYSFFLNKKVRTNSLFIYPLLLINAVGLVFLFLFFGDRI